MPDNQTNILQRVLKHITWSRVAFWVVVSIIALAATLDPNDDVWLIPNWLEIRLFQIRGGLIYITTDIRFFLVAFVLIAYFQMSFHSYRRHQEPERILRLQKDFGLLFEGTPAEIRQNLGRRLSGTAFFPHLFLVSLVTFVGAWLVFKIPDPEKPIIATVAQLEAMRYGFIGAYVFSAQLVYRRYTTMDLHPSVFMYCSFTILAGLFFNFVAVGAIQAIAPANTNGLVGLSGGVAAILAFALGYFPGLAITWFNQVAYKGLGLRRKPDNERPLAMIQGISQFHEVRLRDFGIDNVQNIAAADIQSLLINTTFSAQEVVDWIDQAILILHLNEDALKAFRESGIRSVSDFLDLWNTFDASDESVISNIAQQLRTTPEHLRILARSLEVGPNIHHVTRYWKEVDKVESRSLIA